MREYFNDMFSWIINSSSGTHKLIQLSILLYEFIDKAPFYSGNQITAINTFKVLSKTYGLNPHNIIPISKAFNDISEDIESAFKLAKSKRDLTIFIEAILYTLSLTVIDTSKRVTQEYDKRLNIRRNLKDDLNSRQIKIMEYLSDNPKITRREYSKMMGVSFMTGYRDLQDLLNKNTYLKKEKEEALTILSLMKKVKSRKELKMKLKYLGKLI